MACTTALIVTGLTACGRGDEPAASDPSPSPTASQTTPERTPTVSPSPTPPTFAPSHPAPTSPSPTAPAPTTIPSAASGWPAVLLGRDWTRIPTSERVVALTFDAGANDAAVASILSTLRARGITATFFLTGDFAQRFAGSAQAIAAAGHRLGNHSVNHPHFSALTDAQMRDQLRGATASIKAVTGSDPSPLFRFPYGDVDARSLSVVGSERYVAVRWTVDSLGWQGTSGGMTADQVVERVVAAATSGEIVLMHVGAHPSDGSMLDAQALPTVIDRLRSAGYRFVTLDAMRTVA